MIRVTTIRSWSSQAQDWAGSRPSLLSRLVAFGALVFFGLLGALVLVPVLLIVLVFSGLFAAYVWLRVRLTRARMPNGALDGRRNVRVVPPGEHDGL